MKSKLKIFERGMLFLIFVSFATISGQDKNQPSKLDKLKKEAETIYLMEDFNQMPFELAVEKIGFKKQIGDEDFPVKADGIFLFVKILILNTDKSTKILSAPNAYIKDSTDNHYYRSSNGESETINPLSLKECQPKIKTTAIMVFDVPKKSDNYKLVFEGLSNWPATVELRNRPVSTK